MKYDSVLSSEIVKRILLIICFCGQIIASNGQKYFLVQDTSGNYGVLDTRKNVCVHFKYERIVSMSDCLVLTDSFGKQGLLSKSLGEILPVQFERIKGDCSDWIAAEINGLYGYYDSLGKLMLPHRFIEASLFENDSALVMYKSENEIKLVWINREGIAISKGNINQKVAFNRGGKRLIGTSVLHGLKRKRKHYGIVINGKWVIPPKYESIEGAHSFYIVQSGNLKGLFDRKGLLVFPIIYREIEPEY